MFDFTVVDFETANSDRCSICQIGLVRVENGEISQKYSCLVKPPDNKYSKWNTLIHGINSFITENSAPFPEIWEEIKVFFENQLIVAHNIDFDIDCLYQTLEYYNLEIPSFQLDCTYKKTGVGLDILCQAFDIQLENHHDALQDALACANIYLRLLNNDIPDYSKVKRTAKNTFNWEGHERIKGDLLKPNLKDASPDSLFYGKKVVFTGVLISIEREEAARIVKELGADIDTGITSKTNFVIVGSEPGPSKMKKIEKYNNEGSSILIVNEDDFLKMIKKLA